MSMSVSYVSRDRTISTIQSFDPMYLVNIPRALAEQDQRRLGKQTSHF